MATKKQETKFEPDAEMLARAREHKCFRVAGKYYNDFSQAMEAATPKDVLSPHPIYFGTMVEDEKGNFFFCHRVITQAYVDYPSLPVSVKGGE